MKKLFRQLLLLAAVAAFVAPAAADTFPSANIATIQSLATTNATSIKTTRGAVYGFNLCNKSAAAVFFKFYNKASAPIVGTDTVYLKVMVPTLQCTEHSLSIGMQFPLGIAYAITSAQPDADATAVAAGDLTGSFEYK